MNNYVGCPAGPAEGIIKWDERGEGGRGGGGGGGRFQYKTLHVSN